MNLNKVFIIGRLTGDPQLRTTTSGQPVAGFGIATNRIWINKQGARQEDVQFHNIVVWGRQAEIASQFLKKGSLAFIEGRLQTRQWQDKQGQNRRITEIVCEKIQLGPKSAGGDFKFNTVAPSVEAEDVKEELPEINLEEEEIKPEDLPF